LRELVGHTAEYVVCPFYSLLLLPHIRSETLKDQKIVERSHQMIGKMDDGN